MGKGSPKVGSGKEVVPDYYVVHPGGEKVERWRWGNNYPEGARIWGAIDELDAWRAWKKEEEESK